MPGIEALVLAVLIAWAVDAALGGALSRGAAGAFDAARAQAGAEVRRARQAVIANVKASLRERLERGAKDGPWKSGWWWAWASARSARAVRRAMKGLRDGASGTRSRSLPSAGPWRRIADAAVAGAMAGVRRARQEAAARRAGRPGWRERARQAGRNATAWRHARGGGEVRTGVCDNCGVLTAVTALEPSGWMLLCALCRSVTTAAGDTGTPAPAIGAPGPSGDAGDGGDGVTDAEIVPDPALGAASPTPPELTYQPDANHTDGAAEVMAAGQIARRTAAPAAGVASTGDVTNHGDYDRYSELIAAALDVTTRCQEAMLGNLRSVDAGRTQMAEIRTWSDHATTTAAFIRDMVAGVDARILPLIDVINAQGGTDEIARPTYYAEI